LERIEPGTPIPEVPLVTRTPPGTGQEQRRRKGGGERKPSKEVRQPPESELKETSEESPSPESEVPDPKGTRVDIQV